VTGELLLPGEARYDEQRAIWNGAIDRKPAVIVRVGGPADVATALQFARRNGMEVSVRGGGHGVAGVALSDDGVTVDLSALRTVTVDAARKVAVVGGGASLAELDAATQEHGLAVPAGTVSHTGVGGLALGGGFGWLSRKAGLSCDNLLAAEVVTADGQMIRATADNHPDLFWALKGGGGNFGVVTSFEFQLHEVGPLVHIGFFFFGLDQARDVYRFARDFAPTLPDDSGMLVVGLNAPPAPFVPEQFQFQPGYAVVVAGFAGEEAHARLVAPVREAVTPLFEFVSPIPYVELQKLIDEAAPWGILAYEKGHYIEALTDELIEVIATHQPQKTSPMSITPLFALGGQFARVPEDATAFGGRRSIRFAMTIAGIAPTPDLYDADRTWVRNYWSALAPHAADNGGYVNFMAEFEDDRVRAAYGDKYQRLAEVKATYDPDNVFRLNANIEPAG